MLKLQRMVLVVGLMVLPAVALAGLRTQWVPEPTEVAASQLSGQPLRVAQSSEAPQVVRARLAKLYGQ
jgi:hypothetical protein